MTGGLATLSPQQLPRSGADERWLVERLWLERACGIVGGEPKCCKSLFALAVAAAVASGRPCLGRFAVERPGPVLLYSAEDSAPVLRHRLQGAAAACGADFSRLDIAVVTDANLRLDLDRHRHQLRLTAERVGARLLILDPFARMHRINENQAHDVVPMLGFLRSLQRRCGTSVMLVHHARKAAGARTGQTLRGTSDLHAWGDSNLYLARSNDTVTVTAEHRAAASGLQVRAELRESPQGPALRLHEPRLQRR